MMESPTRLTDSLTLLPVEYWEAEGPVYGALADNVSVEELLLFSIRDIPIGRKLTVRIFYANEYELDSIKGVAQIVSRSPHIAEDWKGYKYALGFVQMSEEELRKLMNLLNSDLKFQKLSGKEDTALGNPPPEKAISSPHFPEADLPAGSTATCKLYKNAKCLRTHAFCDLCHNEDLTDLVQAPGTKSRRSSPFTSILSKLAGNFRSTFQNH